MSQGKVKIITTEDGSHTLYHEELQETYHSFHGAFRESIHVFMLYGLDSWLARNPNKFPIRVFEVGFGTGLNAWLALIWAEQNQVPVLYHSRNLYSAQLHGTRPQHLALPQVFSSPT